MEIDVLSIAFPHSEERVSANSGHQQVPSYMCYAKSRFCFSNITFSRLSFRIDAVSSLILHNPPYTSQVLLHNPPHTSPLHKGRQSNSLSKL